MFNLIVSQLSVIPLSHFPVLGKASLLKATNTDLQNVHHKTEK